MTNARSVLLGGISGLLAAAIFAVGWTYFHDDRPRADRAAETAAVDAPRPPAESAPAPMAGRRTAIAQAAPYGPNPADMMEAASRDTHETAARMESKWLADRADPAQTLETEKGLVETTGAEPLLQVREQPTRLVDVSCRATMCRIESEFPQGASGNEWSTRLLMEMHGAFQSSTLVTLPAANGQSKVVLYAFRRSGPTN